MKKSVYTRLSINALFLILLCLTACQQIPHVEDLFDKQHGNFSDNDSDINSADLYGTWLIKSEDYVAIVVFEDGGTSHDGVGFQGCYTVVEYSVAYGEYIFAGNYWGGYNYVGGGEIQVGRPILCRPSFEEGSSLFDKEITNLPIIYPAMFIKELDNQTMVVEIQEQRFVGTRNTEYVGDDADDAYKKYADLGLSVNWAKCNIGAVAAEQCGDYFGWGDADGQNTSTDYDQYPCRPNDLPSTIINTPYDMAKANWGGAWRIPSISEMWELFVGCAMERITYKGIEGRKYTGVTGESIFLPCAGYREGVNVECVGGCFRYWSGDLDSKDYKSALGEFSGHYAANHEDRYIGCSVRAVCDK